MRGVITNVALVGYGKAGRTFHEPLIRAVDGLQLHAVVRGRGDDYGAVLDDPNVALVVIATPNTSHFDLARRALQAGKHVVVDKPFTVTSNEAGELVDLAQSQRRILSVFHNRRWEGDFITIRELVQRGVFGSVVLYEARFDRFRSEPRPAAWRESSDPGSGILYDLGSHLIDQALLLFGMPLAITADVRRERAFGGSDDAFDIWLHHEQRKVILTAGMLVREKTPRYTVRGTAASFLKFGLDPQEAALASGGSPHDEDFGREPREQWGTLFTANGEEIVPTEPGRYVAFYENVRDAIHEGAPLAVRAEDALQVIRLIELAMQSSRERKTVSCG